MFNFDVLHCALSTCPASANLPSTPLQIQTRRQKLLTMGGLVGTPPTPHRIELRSDHNEENNCKKSLVNHPPAPKARKKLLSDNAVNGTRNGELKGLDIKESSKNGQLKLTEYFPVRRSVRKTKTTVLEEQQLALENLVRRGAEEGLEVRLFGSKGRGVVAAKEFSKGEFVVEYSGELVDIMEAKDREEVYAQNETAGCYMYYFKHNGLQYCIDATKETGRLGRLVNHSRSNPNLVTKTIMVDKKPRLVLLAKDDIRKGEEILYDYGDRSAGDTLGAGGPGAGGDDGIVGGPRTPQQMAAEKRLKQTQAQVDEVVDIMKTNVEKVLERDQKLSELDDRADALQQGASQFEQQAGKLKRKFWLQNLKAMIIMGVIGLVILIIIIMKFMPEEKAAPPVPAVYAPISPVEPAVAPADTKTAPVKS
ncbi:hypothetical protein YQE_11488, partial [Dendroctonus ponderosae]